MDRPPIGYHVICSLENDSVIAPTIAARRFLARRVLQLGRGVPLLAFNAPDTHLHMEAIAGWARCGKLARDIECSLTKSLQLKVGFREVNRVPIRDQAHLYRCFDYILRQQPHHGLAWDPYREASNLPDLLGLRVLGQYTAANVRAHLPRINRGDLLGPLGVDQLVEADGPLDLVVPAALSAAALVSLRGRSAEARAVRRAVLELVGARCPMTDLARLLRVSRQALHETRRVALDERLLRAIRLQLGLRAVIDDAPTGPFLAAAWP